MLLARVGALIIPVVLGNPSSSVEKDPLFAV